MTYLLVFNPQARRYSPAAAAAIVEQARCLLPASTIRVAYTTPQVDAGEVFYDVADLTHDAHDVDCVVAVGGDGTVNIALSALMRRGLQRRVLLGVLPYGTGNNLVRSFGIARDSTRAFLIIRQGHTVNLDVGMINQRYYCINASFGLFAHLLVHRVTHSRLGYTYEAVRHLWTKPWPARLRYQDAAGQSITLPEQCYLLGAILNTSYYASILRMAPDAVSHDGLFDVKLVGGVSAFAYPLVFAALLTGQYHRLRQATVFRAAALELTLDTSCRLEVDGDPLPPQPTYCIAMAGAVRLIVPAAPATVV